MAITRNLFRVGLLGESPNDTEAVKALLSKRYAKQATFFPLLERLTGGTLDSAKTLRALPVAYDRKKPDVIVVIRDLDAVESNQQQVARRQDYFYQINKQVGGKGLFLLNVQEIEALILAHIEAFNTHYHCHCRVIADPMRVPNPKEMLKAATRKNRRQYSENDCAEVCSKLDYEQVITNCRYFREFDVAFASRLSTGTRHK